MSDREYVKKQQVGALNALPTTQVVDPIGAVVDAHSRQRDWVLWSAGPATAATPLAETPCFCVERASKLRSVKIDPAGTAAQDPANYLTITISKRVGAGGATTIATFSTQTGAQGTLTALAQAAFALAAAANLQIAAGSQISVTVTKTGTGAVLAQGSSISFDFEEV